MLEHFKKLDWPLIFSALILVAFGLVSLYGRSEGEGLSNFKKQILWLLVGFVLMIGISFFDYRILKNYRSAIVILYGATLALLAGVLVFGVSIRGAESWYRIGQIAIQPVEFAKIAIIVVLAKYFSMRHIEMYRVSHVLISGAYVLIPAFLVFLQPDIGSVMILFAIWVGVMILAGIKIKHLLLLAFAGMCTFLIAWSFVFHAYQKDRILAFLNPRFDPLGAGYNVSQSMIAIGSGGMWGKGLGEGSQTHLGFLPEAQTDFIYAAIAEELGFIGIILLLTTAMFLFWKLMNIARNATNNFSRLVAGGFSIMILVQIAINIGMNLGLLPVTGVPLPFVSYGGSSMIALFVMLGLLQSIKVNQ